MASAIIEATIPGITGFNLLLDLYPLSSDTPSVSGLLCTEATNRKGTYTVTTTAGLTGLHLALLRESGTQVTRGEGYVLMDDTTGVHRVVGHPWINDIGATYAQAAVTVNFPSGLTAEQVWSYSERTLTMTASEVASVLSGSTITIQRGDTVSINITGLGNLSSRTSPKLWFTIKRSTNHADSKSIIQITETGGLITQNGDVATDSTLGSITVNDATTGDVTILLKPGLTASLEAYDATVCKYDLQMLSSGMVTTLTSGLVNISPDVTRAIA